MAKLCRRAAVVLLFLGVSRGPAMALFFPVLTVEGGVGNRQAVLVSLRYEHSLLP